MRIVLDLQGAQTNSRFRGIGRYCLSLAKAIVRNQGNHDIRIVLNGLFPDSIEPIRTAFDRLLPQENIHVWHAAGPVNANSNANRWRQKTAEILREDFIQRLQPDIVYILSGFEGYGENAVVSIGTLPTDVPVSVTLFDLIPHIYQEEYLSNQTDFADFYRKRFDSVNNADFYLAISESARREAIEHLNASEEDIVNIAAAAEDIFRPIEISAQEKDSLLNRLGIRKPFLMYTTAPDQRKNHKRLVSAFSLLPDEIRKKYQLVLVGSLTDDKHDEIVKYARRCNLNDQDVVLTGHISDGDLIQLYNLCVLFVFPSWHEGFGLPALEAMSCGAPVIASNTSSLPEVLGREDALFNPFDETAITEKIIEVLENPTYRDELAAHGLSYAQNFSWDKSAKRAIEAFETWSEQNKTSIARIKNNKVASEDIIEMIARLPERIHNDTDLLRTAAAMTKNTYRPSKKRLLVDISELSQRDAASGIQRVVRSVLAELLKNPPEDYTVEPIYATLESNGYLHARNFVQKFNGRTSKDIENEIVDAAPGDIFLGLDFQMHVVHRQQETLDEWHRRGVEIHFVVYDLLPIIMPDYFPPQSKASQETWLRIITRYDGAVCISRTTADDLYEWLKDNDAKTERRPYAINWFHLGADIESSSPSAGLPEDANSVLHDLRGRPTFLMVSTIEPRKGHTQTLRAFERLWTKNFDINLVFVGHKGWNMDRFTQKFIDHEERNKRLFWLESISDEYLMKIYDVSTCYIAASEGEGFGLPLIECAHHNLPIIARDIDVFREVAGPHAFYFSGLRPKDIEESVIKWLQINAASKSPQSGGMPWLTWSQSTSMLVKSVLTKTGYRLWTGKRNETNISIPAGQNNNLISVTRNETR